MNKQTHSQEINSQIIKTCMDADMIQPSEPTIVNQPTILEQLFSMKGGWAVLGYTKSSNKVLFVRNVESGEVYAIKLFSGCRKGDHDYKHEIDALSALSDSQYVVRHLETGARGNIPSLDKSSSLKYVLP